MTGTPTVNPHCLAHGWCRVGFVGATLKLAAHVGVENFLVVRRERGGLVVFGFADARQRADK